MADTEKNIPGNNLEVTMVMDDTRKNTTSLRSVTQLSDIIEGKPQVIDSSNLQADSSADFRRQLENTGKRYKILKMIAEGGFGKIFLAKDLVLGREVVIKSLKTEHLAKPASVEKFISEAKLSAQLDHPAIVPPFSLDTDTVDGLHLAMQLINGITLKEFLNRCREKDQTEKTNSRRYERTLQVRLESFLKICDAIEYSHSRGIIHCDLKPENIMLGKNGEVYVMDWGIACPNGTDRKGNLEGTPAYMPPECFENGIANPQTDVFALGMILNEIVTLRKPVSGDGAKEIVEKIRAGKFEPSTPANPRLKIRSDLRAIIEKARAADPEERYRSARELAADIRRYLFNEEVSAYPDSPIRKFTRFLYRHWLLMFITTLTMVTLGAVAISFALYKQVKAEMIEQARSEFRNSRDHELGKLLARVIGVSRTLDRQITNLEHELTSVTTNALMLLNIDVRPSVDEPIWSRTMLAQGKVPPTLAMARGFGYEIDLENIVYHIAPGAKPAKPEERVRRLSMLRPEFLHALVESRQDHTLAEHNLPILKRRLLDSGAPLIDVYLGFKDGLFVLYPCSKILPENFDHRQRPWYKERMADLHTTAAVAKWGSPYLSVDGDMMLPCTLPMVDIHGNFHGVSAIDVSIRKLVKTLRSMSDGGKYLREKTIVDANGWVVVDHNEKFFRESNGNSASIDQKSQRARYKDIPLFERIKSRRTGIIIRTEKGRNMAYLFSGMYSVEWYYIEKIDLDAMLRERGVEVPAGTNPGML